MLRYFNFVDKYELPMFLNPKKKIFILILSLGFLGVIATAVAQSPKKAFKTLSKPEKYWVYFHPFRAQKAYRISKSIEKVVDSIAHQNTLGKVKVGNQLDAFKHSFWMWSLAEEIGWRAAKSLGKAHEKGNYQMYLNKELEDGKLPDKASSEMDAFNNQIGITLYKTHKHQQLSKQQRIALVIKAVLQGKTRMLSQTKKGVFLNSKKQIILPKNYIGKWENERHLVPSKSSNIIDDNLLK